MIFFILPALAPQLVTAAHIAPTDYGILAGAVGLGSVLFYLVNNAVTPVLGPLGTLRLGVIIAIAGLALLLTGQWPIMIAGGLLIGIAYATSTPAGSQILADFTPRTVWGTMFSFRQASVPVGGIIAGLIAATSIAPDGWHSALMYCLFIVACLGLVLLATPQRFNTAHPLVPFSLHAFVAPSNITRPFRDLITVKGMASLVAAGCGLCVVHGAVTSFLVLYLTSGLGIASRTAALLFVVVQAVAIFGRIFFGAVADRLRSPLQVLRFLAPLSALSAVMLASFDTTWAIEAQLAAAVTIGLTVGTWNGLYLSEIARLAPQANVGNITASAAVFSFLAYAITPPLFGVLVTSFGWRKGFAMIATAALASGIILTLRHWRERG